MGGDQGDWMKRVLVVDDSKPMRHFIAAGLAPYFEVAISVDGSDALERILAESFDLVVTDLEMPNLHGFGLHREVRRWDPTLPVVLITDTDIDRWLPMAEKQDVGHIIPKALLQSDFEGFVAILQGLVRHFPFGLSNYLAPGGECRTYVLGQAAEVPALQEKTDEIFHHYPRANIYRAVLGMLLQNALSYGVPDLGLGPGRFVTVSVGADARRVGLAVGDPAGSLRRRELLHWLAHPTPEGSRGWGFQILRRFMNTCLIQLREGTTSEIVCLDLLEPYQGPRPLAIYEENRNDS